MNLAKGSLTPPTPLSWRRRGSKNLAALVLLVTLACSGKGNVDLSKATPLTAEPVETPKQAPVVPNALFNYAPGTAVDMKSLGTIDGTGTSLVQDYDGDGIPNQNELTSNKWVSDYPVVEASIAPPVTMKVQILTSSDSVKDDIVSQINSDDYEDVKQKGTEKLHQNEVNARTTMVQDWSEKSNSSSGSTSSSNSSEENLSIGFGPFSVGGGGSSSSSREESWSNKTAYGATKTEFPTVPFKNNLDRDAISVKSDSAARNARKYRSDKGIKKTTTDKIMPNAGTVRAALYIKNLSVNMPVHLTNILCTLMFETNSGQLVPIQSFRLRNDDYSLFSVNVYGGSEFGPYVVDLPSLNTAEVERALQLGFNPKIFIVDYDMTHVANSNYKNVLTSYQGDNLKIVEENAKGRTALIKLKGPQMREMYRVAAFSTSDQNPALCTSSSGVAACPGIPMRTALQRIRDAAVVGGQTYTATNIEYGDYIFDFSAELPRMPLSQQKVYLRGIKTIGSISSTVPCEPITQTSPAASTVAVAENVAGNIQICKAKPFAQWSASEKIDFGLWVVFANGKFYNNSQYEKNGTNLKTFAYNTTSGGICDAGCNALVAQGIDGTVWAGDNYDLVYITLEQFLALQNRFGNNPMETGEIMAFNTKWDLGIDNANIFDPQFHSKFIGQSALGEKIEVTIKLENTKYLNPRFGADTSNGNIFVSDFSYNTQTIDKKFSFEEAIDFEVNLGNGGTHGDWANITQTENSQNAYYVPGNGNGVKNCGKSLDYLAQEYKLCIQLPTALPNVGSDGKVNVYLRPILHNTYRNSVWPKKKSEVNKFQGELATTYAYPATVIDLVNVSGNVGDVSLGTDQIIIADSDAAYSCNYTVVTLASTTGGAHATLSAPVCNGTATSHTAGLATGVLAGLTQSEVYFSVSQSPLTGANYFQDLNTVVGPTDQLLASTTAPLAGDCANASNPLRFGPNCFGVTPASDDVYSFLTSNWVGGINVNRHANDASHWVKKDYLTTLADAFFPALSATSRWRVAPMGSVLGSLAPSFSNTMVSTLDVARKVEVFQHLDRTLILWETWDGNARRIWVRIISSKSNVILTNDTLAMVDSPTDADTEEFTPMQFAASQKDNTVTLAYGSSTRLRVHSGYDSTIVPNSFTHSSRLYARSIDILSGVLSGEILIKDTPEFWLKSYQIMQTMATGKFDIAYSAQQFSYDKRTAGNVSQPYCDQTIYDFGAGPAPGTMIGAYCFYHLSLLPAPFNANPLAYPNPVTYSNPAYPGSPVCVIPYVSLGAGSWQVAPPAGCGFNDNAIWVLYHPILYTTVTGSVQDIKTVGADEMAIAEVDASGNVAEAPHQGCGPNWSIEHFKTSNNGQVGIIELRDQPSNTVRYTRYVSLSDPNKSPIYETGWAGAIIPAGHDPQPFGASTFAAVGASANGRAHLVVEESGLAPQFYGIGDAAKACTANKCVNMRKYALNAADILWLEDEANGTRSLYQAQVTITDAAHASITSARLIYNAANIDSPEILIASERTMVASWIESGAVKARALDKASATLLGTSATPVYTPAGAQLLGTKALNDHGNFYAVQSTSQPGQNALQLLQIKENTAFSPKYGLNNFFTAPLIERNYSVTAKVILD